MRRLLRCWARSWRLPRLGEAAKVYKWTDARATSSTRTAPGRGAEVIELPTEPAGIVPVPPQQMPPPKPADPGTDLRRADRGLAERRTRSSTTRGGWVNVSLAVEPPLRVSQGDAIRLKLDGQTLDTRYTGSEIAIPSVPRGTHTLQAEVVNPAGNVLIASRSVTFHVQAPSSPGPGRAGHL